MLSEYQQQLRDTFLAAPVLPAPHPWRLVLPGPTPIGGLLGVGSPSTPTTGTTC